MKLTPESDVRIPATEVEVAELLRLVQAVDLASKSKHAITMRKLAFERDRYKQLLERCADIIQLEDL